MPAPIAFVQQVRHALAHLYDPDVLRAHPLLAALGLGARANPQAALRDSLLAAVEALRPATTMPVSSRAWRVYKVLHCRYVQQLDQQQTATQLGVGVRHVRREQHAAVEALADVLYEQRAAVADVPAGGEGVGASGLGSELSWLKEQARGENAVVAEALAAALRLAAPLAAARGVTLVEPAALDLPPAAIHPSALRQALVSAATYAIRRAPGGVVRVVADCPVGQIVLHISADGAPLLAVTADEAASLQTAGAIIGMANGALEATEDAARLSIAMRLAPASRIDVLLIDDNADFAQLFARYVAGTRYHVQRAGAADLFDLLAANRPQIIVLDVMMPGVDGWEMLGRLRQHPLSSHIPVVICTILPERDLALALGASAFLPKPVTRQALIEELDRSLGTTRPESR